MQTVALPCGESVPALGLGTWGMGEDRAQRRSEIAALQRGLDLGATLIDTAEMYADGGAEQIVAAAVKGRRDATFIVSKVYPHNATASGTRRACEASLRRLGTDRIDLYLLHWRGAVPLEESIGALAGLQRAGKIRHYGVSNLDRADLESIWALPESHAIQTDQVLYNLTRRGVEWDLQPWLRAQAVPIMAYSPLEQARLLNQPALEDCARRHGATPAQVALAWLLMHDGVIAIPKSSNLKRVEENVSALELALDRTDCAQLNRAFPPPQRATPLEML